MPSAADYLEREFGTLSDLLRLHAAERGASTAIVDPDRTAVAARCVSASMP